MTQKRTQIWLPLALSATMIIGLFIGFKLSQKTNTGNFLQTNKKATLQEVIDLMKNKYVDKLNTDSITDETIDKLLAQLDPHSAYIPPSKLEKVNEELMGNFKGIGLEFLQINDTVHITYVAPNGPSKKAGLSTGDKIIAINTNTIISGKKILGDSVRNIIRNSNSKEIKLQILRGNKAMEIKVEKGNVPISVIEAAYKLNDTTGYIRFNKFGERTYEEFMQQLDTLINQGIKALVIDVRGNGGGLLNEAVAIADEFLDDNKLIVYTNGSNSGKIEYNCKKEGLFEKGKLILLIDETSASASEVLAGALQDWDRATIIGRRSFGKGLVQQQYNLSNGGAIRLTTARYFTPLSRNIQKDYVHTTKEMYNKELLNRFATSKFQKSDTVTSPQKYKTPKGKTVYGGGGITPDVFVAADTTFFSPLMHSILFSSALNIYAYQKVISNPTLQIAKNTAPIFKEILPSIVEIENVCKLAGISFAQLSPLEINYLKIIMQAMVARQLFRTQGYLEIINNNDIVIKKALEVLN
jgi:carboxyl-terminal processing protease